MIEDLIQVEADRIPASSDVVVIGGGIVGACTALSLAERGASVTLVEKGDIGAEQSSQNWGWVRKMGRDPREIPLMFEAEDLWSRWTFSDRIDTGYTRSGITYFADKEADIRRYDNWLAHTRKFNLDTRVLSASEAMDKGRGATRSFVGALHTPSDGMAEPTRAAPAIAAAAQKKGARIVTRCAARTIDINRTHVTGVHTEKGFIRASNVVLAGGGWSSLLLRAHDIRLPQLKLAAQVMRTGPVASELEGCGSGNGFGYRKRWDGGYILSARGNYPVDIVPDSFRFFRDYRSSLFAELRSMRFRVGRRSWDEILMQRRWDPGRTSPFERFRHYRPTVDRPGLDRVAKGIAAIFPAFRDATIVERWAGFIDTTPDALPVISPVDGRHGLYVSTGFSGHGFGLAPGAGLLIAQMITGESQCVDATSFRYSRFADGSPIEYWPLGL
jgi:glycine/D-amino acid oxidase-like deaminating enzyme